MKKPEKVVIGDVHFSLNTLELASCVLAQAILKAQELNVPLLINGDFTNDKANLRGEVLNSIVELLLYAKKEGVSVIISIGNHDRINEKSPEHSLNCLKPYAQVVDTPNLELGIIPYCHSNEEFLKAVSLFEKDKILYVHQGLQGAYLGEYVQDKSSVLPESLAGRRIIASHYHRKQDISLPDSGLWSYIGSPYTITHSEASDGAKGISVVYTDGSIELIPTNLRKHVKVKTTVENAFTKIEGLNSDDILWFQVTGTHQDLDTLDKNKLGDFLLGHSNFKLEKVYTDLVYINKEVENLTNSEILDGIIDSTGESESRKKKLKTMWRDLLRES